jgi:hypothetical protein
MLDSRVLSSIDVSRLADAVSRPGIDPRVWVSYAIVQSEPVVETAQGQQDVFVDVLLVPTMQPDTARLCADYAGNGFGLYAPLHKDDEVVVIAPSGDPDEGLVIARRCWSPSDLPPAEAGQFPDDVLLVVEPGKNVRITTSGGGKVFLGDTEATQPVALGGTVSASAEMVAWMTKVSAAVNIVVPPVAPNPPLAPPTTFGDIPTAGKVNAG